MDRVEKEGEDYGYATFIDSIDTVIMGRRTYEWVMSRVENFPHADKDTYIITREMRQRVGNTRFYADDLKELIAKLKMKGGKDIFVDGGAEVVRMMMADHLLDELIISIIPVILGGGKRLFADQLQETDLELIKSETFATGLVQLVYRIPKKMPFQSN